METASISQASPNTNQGRIQAIAFRRESRAPMEVSDACRVLVSRGIEREHRAPGRRNLTLLCADRWADACRDLGLDLAWVTRRANLLVEGLNPPETVGYIVTIGSIRVRIHGETKPCQLMDDLCPGLREVLRPDFRGGVYGQVLDEGTICVGDRLALQPEGRLDRGAI